MSFAKRLKQYIDYKGISVRFFETKSTLKNGAIYRVIRNDTSLNGESIASIGQNWADLNLNWLMTGVGEMIIPSSNDIKSLQESKEKLIVSPDEKWDKDALLHRADNQIQLQQEMIILLKDIIERQKKAAEKAGFDI